MSQSLTRQVNLAAFDGQRTVPGLISLQVSLTGERRPGSFQATFALYADPSNFGLIYWMTPPKPFTFEFFLQLNSGTPTSLFVGDVDDVDVAMEEGVVTLKGRDLAARLVEAKTAESFRNQTVSEVAATLAARHGLKTDLLQTSMPVYRFWQIDHTLETSGHHHDSTNEWALLAKLAKHEGLDLYVARYTLTLQKPLQKGNPGVTPWQATFVPPTAQTGLTVPVANVIGLNMKRSLTVAKNVKVTVKSFGSKSGTSVVRTAQRQDSEKGKRDKEQAQEFIVVRPNLTGDQALQLAQSTLQDITRHERVINFMAPGDTALTPWSLLELGGTNTSYDQVYYPQKVTYHIDVKRGFEMSVEAKNHSLASMETQS